LKGRSQERIRYEIRPAGSERIKAPGGCENLKVQAVEISRLDQMMPLLWVGKTLKGSQTSREALPVGVWFRANVRFLENQRLKAAARCLGCL